MSSSRHGIYAAIAGNLAVATTKFVAAAIGGSSAMLTEGIHSLVDTSNGVLLLLGLRLSQRPPDEAHPFGHGKELYFHTLMVAVLIFGLGGGVSIYEGILHVLEPAPVTDARLNYIVIALAVVFEGIAGGIALKGFLKTKGRESIWATIRSSKDPSSFAVLFEDGAAIAGLLVAAAGIFLSERLEMPELDGAASIVIGVLLCTVATLLLRESKGLLLGEAVKPDVSRAIRATAERDPAVESIGRLLTMHLGPEEILLNVDVRFRRELSGPEIAAAVDRLEKAIRDTDARVRHIFIEATLVASAARTGQGSG
ncbi:MAG: cation diffusion facilitator family transporter [Vicinamibacterales bacterium]